MVIVLPATTHHFFFPRLATTALAPRTARPSSPVICKMWFATWLHCRFSTGVSAFFVCRFASFAPQGITCSRSPSAGSSSPSHCHDPHTPAQPSQAPSHAWQKAASQSFHPHSPSSRPPASTSSSSCSYPCSTPFIIASNPAGYRLAGTFPTQYSHRNPLANSLSHHHPHPPAAYAYRPHSSQRVSKSTCSTGNIFLHHREMLQKVRKNIF